MQHSISPTCVHTLSLSHSLMHTHMLHSHRATLPLPFPLPTKCISVCCACFNEEAQTPLAFSLFSFSLPHTQTQSIARARSLALFLLLEQLYHWTRPKIRRHSVPSAAVPTMEPEAWPVAQQQMGQALLVAVATVAAALEEGAAVAAATS